jgi:hypothetical protein
MNRRHFLAFLGIAPAVPSPEIAQALKEYNDHSNLSDHMTRGWVTYKFHYTVGQ